ncbi:sugar ABC transporter permease [Naumannella sp. ID2617S]|uniref:ABC transporter permease n=1 Tax=Enemella dayhoffiae TaxID=2016507 RepID=A0A255H185_9ACTN|nr:sugar ABC transporter permease [Enemella dayhoffiae]NNG20446.1 sugar ABC transporter permease [Naumannella sp. ID2617S]OYO21372.1 ABC transporter permease [Enemella dayhoffiae]
MKRGRIPFLLTFLALPLVIFTTFVLSPFVQAFDLSTTDWSGLSPTFNRVGFQNYADILGLDGTPDQHFWHGLMNNAILLVTVPLLTIAIALFFATMLNLAGTRSGQIRGVWGAPFYRFLFFVPQVISVAALGILFGQVFQPRGLLNALLGLVGIEGRSWLADERTALICVIAVMVWMHVGFYMVYFSAAMASIPRELLEAASIDRASKLQTFFRVTLPLLWPAVQTALIYLAIFCLDGLAIIQVMTIGPGGPNGATEVMALSVYRSFKEEAWVGYASAQAVLVFILTSVLLALAMRITRREQVQL